MMVLGVPISVCVFPVLNNYEIILDFAFVRVHSAVHIFLLAL